MTTSTHRPLGLIAQEIRKDWGDKLSPHAKPYLAAMLTMDKITDDYGLDPGTSIVAYFRANSAGWRGEKAREIKKELDQMLKDARK